eukprot:scaffold99693_cov20-Tisochrysis_lutea.AAC.1
MEVVQEVLGCSVKALSSTKAAPATRIDHGSSGGCNGTAPKHSVRQWRAPTLCGSIARGARLVESRQHRLLGVAVVQLWMQGCVDRGMKDPARCSARCGKA